MKQGNKNKNRTRFKRDFERESNDGGWAYGQLTKPEVELFCKLAKGRQEPIVLSGSLSETDLGLRNRYTEIWHFWLPDYRRKQPKSSLVGSSVVRDIDIWEGSRLEKPEIAQICAFFISQNPAAFSQMSAQQIEQLVDQNYSLEHYKTLEAFSKQAGCLIFHTDGVTVERVPAPWQLAGWPFYHQAK